jgi:DNA-binding CsgD family transcriptional regulator
MVEKSSKKVNSKKKVNLNGLSQRRNIAKKKKLTKTESEVLHLLHIECLTPVQIAKRRKVSKSSVSRSIRKLKEKGFFNVGLKRLTHGGVGMSSPIKEHPFRLHGQRFYIEILDKTEAFLKKINKIGKRIEFIEGNYVTYNENFIQIMAKKDFWAETPLEAETQSLEYWTKFILKLEQKLKIVLLKDSYENIRYSKSGEFAETNNELARDFNNRKDKLQIRGTEDNKVWLIIDNSFNLNEMETTHSKFSMDDSIKVTDHFNDIRDFPVMRPKEISQIVGEISRNIEELSRQQAKMCNSQTNTNDQLNAVLGLHKNLFDMINKPTQKYAGGDTDEFDPKNSSVFM